MKKHAKHAKPSKSARFAARSLGAVALGAAFAAAGGGVAAADTGLPAPSDTLAAVDQTLPLGEVAQSTLPAGVPEAVGSGVRAAGTGADALVDKATGDPVSLLAELPNVDDLGVQGLPTDALLRG
ncbi:hypothetical protein [Streptomyces sp. BBFR102]|uniref:hypothetical protein n=1 Tax=Streptomyces sp. BBFR102 TaxID=3448171 RepID=UPI003F53DBB1